MSRRILCTSVAIATFALSLVISPKPITFSCNYMRSGFRTHYHSSDGQSLLYGCYEHDTPWDAERDLHDEIRPNYKTMQEKDGSETPVRIVEHTFTVDSTRRKTGERVVLDDGELLWVEGSRIHHIYAGSVQYALLFEASRTWSWEGCMER